MQLVHKLWATLLNVEKLFTVFPNYEMCSRMFIGVHSHAAFSQLFLASSLIYGPANPIWKKQGSRASCYRRRLPSKPVHCLPAAERPVGGKWGLGGCWPWIRCENQKWHCDIEGKPEIFKNFVPFSLEVMSVCQHDAPTPKMLLRVAVYRLQLDKPTAN